MPTFPIREAIPATPRAHIIRLDLQGQSFPYQAGQAAYLQPQGAEKRRPYSIASAPEETARHGLIEFLVQTGQRWLIGTDAGAGSNRARPLTVEGPLGSFTFPAHPRERQFVFIAGGTGIAPLRSMLWHALLAERHGKVGLDLQRALTRRVRLHAGIPAARRRRTHRLPPHRHARRDRRLDRPPGAHRFELSGRADRAGRDSVLSVRTAGARRRDSAAAEAAGRQRRSDSDGTMGGT